MGLIRKAGAYTYTIKNPVAPEAGRGLFGVANGARTHDPQNHNLML